MKLRILSSLLVAAPKKQVHNGSLSSEVLLLITIGKHELFMYLAYTNLKHCLSLR